MNKGVSLIETLLVVVTLSAVTFLIANIPNAFNLINKSKHLSTAREIAAKVIEDKRSLSFANLVNDNSAILDLRINLLPQGSGTVVVEDCSQQICPNLEPVKQVTVTLNWKEGSKQQQISLKTLIGEGGLSK